MTNFLLRDRSGVMVGRLSVSKGLRSTVVSRGAMLIVLLALLIGGCGPRPTPTPVVPTPFPGGIVPVMVIQRVPERGEELPIDGAIELVFDRAMDRSSVEKAFQIEPSVKGTFEWVNERTVRFMPSRELERDTEYVVTLDVKAKAVDGSALESPYRFSFRTTGFLRVAQVIPADGTQDVDVASTITVIFNRPVVPLTAVSGPQRSALPPEVQDLIRFDPPIVGRGEWVNTSIYVFTPERPLAGGTTYRARISAGLTDTTGGVLAEDYLWSFSTQPPQVVWVSPVEGAELVAVDAPIQVTFNMPVSVDAGGLFRLEGAGRSVPGVVAIQDAVLTFTPTERLAFNTLYTARVEAGVTSVGGGVGMREAYEWQFKTVPLPRILGTTPYDGQRDAFPYTSFEIRFNAPIDPATVMPNLEMTPPLSPALVYTYFNTSDNTFVLNFGAQPSTEYIVRIGPNIADPYGNTTGQEMTVRFRTAPLDPWVGLAMPGTIGTLDAGRPARVVIAFLNTTRLDLSLYRLDRTEFFRMQQDWWTYEPKGPVRSWSVPVEAVLNQTAYKAVNLREDGGPLAPGIYLLQVQAPNVNFDPWSHRRLLIVSQYNVTVKTGLNEAWAWVTDLATGEPVKNMRLEAIWGDGSPLGTATTNADGLAQFALLGHYPYDTLYIMADEPFILGGSGYDWSTGIAPWDFGLDVQYERTDYRAHIYTDRPLYRPGQIVYFRAIFRDEDDVRYELPRVGQVSISIYDPQGTLVYTEEQTLDPFGTTHGQFRLAEGAPLGLYSIQATIGGETFYGEFNVASYRAPEFEVVVTPDQSEVAIGQTVRVTVEVRYFFGGPVAEANVDWNVQATPYRFEPPQFGRYTFSDEDDPWICRWCWWEPPAPNVLSRGSGVTDGRGTLTVLVPTESLTTSQRLTIEATAYGRDGQAISGRADVIVHRGEFYVGLAPQQYVSRAGERTAVDVVTVDWEGKRVPNQPLEVRVVRREWINRFVESDLGGTWEWEAVDTPVYTGSLTTDANAEGVVRFTPLQGGTYRVIVSGRDRREREVRSSIWVWVSGSEYVSWRRENADRITLISDKSSYTPGETAEILIPSPFAGVYWAWITVERGSILYQEVLRLESNSTLYSLPIKAEYAPNIYVSVVLFKGPDATEPVAAHKVGCLPLTVEPVAQRLTITLAPSTGQAEPRETVSFEIRATDASGEPVQAALSLDLVDKAVLSLLPRQPDAIERAFYGQRGLGVWTASGLALSLNRLLLEQLQTQSMASPGMGGGGGAEGEALMPAMPVEAPLLRDVMGKGLREGGQPLPPGVELREEFVDTAFWDATVVTDQTGRASVSIPLPDNLTTWVFRGVGVTVNTQVGEATVELVATKPLLVRPVTPRFFVVGDRVQLAALVSNNTGRPQRVEVTLHARGVALEGPASQVVSIADGAEAKVTWWVTVEDVSAADIVMSAVAGDYSDAARPRLTTGPEGTLIVNRYTAPEVIGTGGQLSGEETRVEVVALPPKYDGRRGELLVRLDPSLAAGMVDGLAYLEHFPYECTEQTVSRFLPNVLTYRALSQLGLSNQELAAKLPGLVQEGLDKLYTQQRAGGGWGWWSESESNPHLSAYVVLALVKAREAGFAVKTEVLERGLDYLEGTLVSARELRSYREANQQAFVLYVMAEAGRAGRASRYIEALYQRRDKLSHYGRAFLALALQLASGGDGRIRTLLSDLQNAAIVSATGAHWEEADYDWWAMNTDTRSTAVILEALVRLDPQNALIPQVVRWLMVARRGGVWETTQETAWALIALTDWMVISGELKGQYDYIVQLNDESLAQGTITPATVTEPIQLRVAVEQLLADVGNRLLIGRGPGEGRLYYTTHLNVYLPVEEIEPLNRGIIVSRQYCANTGLVSGQAAEPGKEQTCTEVSQAQVGDVVEVRLTVIAPHDLYYVVLEDPLPAGTEAIDPTLATTSWLVQEPSLIRQVEEGDQRGFYRWWWRWYSRSEIRDDRVVLFADYLPAGTYEYVYTFRAVQPGEYRVIPTTAREFYFPEVFGRGDGQVFTVLEAQR